MIPDFNLLATTDRGFESEASSELWILLREIGDQRPLIDRAPVRGVALARISLDPLEAIGRLRNQLRTSPQDFRCLYRIIPVEKVVPSETKSIVDAARELASKIGDGDSFRITVEKRRTALSGRELITAIAEGIDRRVDLENPDWVILVEIVGRLTGVSVIHPDSLLNVQKERAKLPSNGQ